MGTSEVTDAGKNMREYMCLALALITCQTPTTVKQAEKNKQTSAHCYNTVIDPTAVPTLVEFRLRGLFCWKPSSHTCQIITARRYASTAYAVIVCLSVRPSVCLSVCHKSEFYTDDKT